MPPSDNENALRAYQLLAQAERAMSERLCGILDRFRLSVPDALLLLICFEQRKTGVVQRALVQRLNVSASGISTRLESLRKDGLLTASREQGDRRLQIWRVTCKGTELAGAVHSAVLDGFTGISSVVFDESLCQLLDSLCQQLATIPSQLPNGSQARKTA